MAIITIILISYQYCYDFQHPHQYYFYIYYHYHHYYYFLCLLLLFNPSSKFFIFENNDDMKRLAKEKKWGITFEISDYIHFNVNTKKCVILTQRYSLS